MSTIYFWKPQEKPYGIFCQWYNSPFRDSKDKLFHNAEQYMMYQKAMLFNDTKTAERILEDPNPRFVKQLGRLVVNFSDFIWNQNRSRIAYEGNLFKFKSKKGLKQVLVGTNDRVLAEASPFDRIWGIGYKEDEAEGNKKRWGKNLLGEALMKVRQTLQDEERVERSSAALQRHSRPTKNPSLC